MPENKAKNNPKRDWEKTFFPEKIFENILTRKQKNAREKNEKLCPRRPQSVREKYGSTSPVNHPPSRNFQKQPREEAIFTAK